jgi:hypothetical protein
VLNLDVGADGVGPRISIEYFLCRREQVRGRLREAAFLDRLVERGLCTPRRGKEAAAGLGVSLHRLPHEMWESLVTFRLNHVKLVYTADGAVEAKAYHSLHAVPRLARARAASP